MSRIFSSRLATMLVAVVLAVGAAAAVVLYVSRYKADVTKQQAAATVLVAAKDIPVGTSGEKAVSDGYVESVKIQVSAKAPTAVASGDELTGRVASQVVYAGAQILSEQFPPKPNNLTSLTVKGSYRAVQVPLDTSRGIVPTLKEGDHVDVLASFTVTPIVIDPKTKLPSASAVGQPVPVTVTLLRGIEVLAIPDTSEDQSSSSTGNTGSANTGNSSGAPQYALLALTDADAQKVVYAAENGKIWLTLRGERATDSWRDSAKRSTVTTLDSMIAGLKGYELVSPQSIQKAGQTSSPSDVPSGS